MVNSDRISVRRWVETCNRTGANDLLTCNLLHLFSTLMIRLDACTPQSNRRRESMLEWSSVRIDESRQDREEDIGI